MLTIFQDLTLVFIVVIILNDNDLSRIKSFGMFFDKIDGGN